ncbi:MAG: phosphomannomutase [Nitrospirales bacterium]|nr:phosphomannomutase [Nitrospirales bacterium]
MSIFREYDIRGVVGEALTFDDAEMIGRAYATFILENGGRTVAVGRDGRLTSPALCERFLQGLLSSGVQVLDLGECATPLLYFSLFHLPVDGGVMITGSHNAAEYNGFKLCRGQEALYGEDIQQLRQIIEAKRFVSGEGSVTERPIIPDYLAFLKEHFSGIQAAGLHVVIDCGNGAASLVAKDALEQMGCQVSVLYGELDGRFPHHHPDPTVVENLQDLREEVRRTHAAVGIGYDGDADRIGAIDEQGNIVWGDQLLLVFARDLLASQPGATVISEVKASQTLYDDIQRRGGHGIMWKAGHSVMKAKMKETSALLAGEMSGHLFFADRYFGYDDAIYASCRLVEILVRTRQSLSTLLADLPPTSVTPEIRVDCPDAQKFQLVDAVRVRLETLRKGLSPDNPALTIREVITIDGVRIHFDGGWGLLRASNTQPALVLRFEASSSTLLEVYRSFLEEILHAAQRELKRLAC